MSTKRATARGGSRTSTSRKPAAKAAATRAKQKSLDPVTFEVLKNSYISAVDQMAEQIIRTCYSFVIYNRDFSSALNDINGDSIAQGNQDISVHVGTLHYSCKAVINAFKGDMHPGDVFIVNDPYAGGTHFNDVRLIRPIFVGKDLIGYAQSNGHWADIGGSVPGSFDVQAKDMFREGLRITPTRLYDKGALREDVARLIAASTRDPETVLGDMRAQAEATRVAEREILRLVKKYGKDTVVAGFNEVQNYVERATRQRLRALPNGSWETTDYLDQDPAKSEGLIPIKVKLTIDNDEVIYDFSGSHPTIGTLYNSAFGTTFSGVVAGMKTFFPDLPLNSGFYRPIRIIAPENSVVDARWPVAVTGFLMVFEKIMAMMFELWSNIMPERAIAAAYQLEYLLTGGTDLRFKDKPYFMYYDWLPGGWGGRQGKDGCNSTCSPFGVGLMVQPIEGQERLSPILVVDNTLVTDSGGPGKWRGGVGINKTSRLNDAEGTVLSYICDRERSIAFGIKGGSPSNPHGLWLHRKGENQPVWLGAVFSDVPIGEGDEYARVAGGGGGLGDPLERDPKLVAEDVADDYVSVERARTDYGVVLRVVDADLARYEVDEQATKQERARIRAERKRWIEEDPESVAARYRKGELSEFDLVRRYGVIVDWGTGEVLPKTTAEYRRMLKRRTAAYWDDRAPTKQAAE
ncbi:MAG: hydantoinase B/oxoprolinase family protein [Alphaproteobacteria bacterium]